MARALEAIATRRYTHNCCRLQIRYVWSILAIVCPSLLYIAGLLAVGTAASLSVYTLALENDLPTWSLKWSLPYVLNLLSYQTIVKVGIW